MIPLGHSPTFVSLVSIVSGVEWVNPENWTRLGHEDIDSGYTMTWILVVYQGRSIPWPLPNLTGPKFPVVSTLQWAGLDTVNRGHS